MRAAPLAFGLAVLCAAATASPAVAATPRISHRVVTSFDGVPLYTTLFVPPDADSDHPVPLVMRGHGWSQHGERDLSEASTTTEALLDAGYAVLTWDERGFGYSGGEAGVLKPEAEGRDASALIDHVATDPEIAPIIECETGRGEDGTCDDPVIGMTGQSYGGGIQLLTAAFDAEFSGTASGSRPRVDAIAPEITWNDLRYSLYADSVTNFGWAGALYALGVPTARGEGLDPRNPAGPQSGGLHPRLHRAQWEAVTTNDISERSREFFGDSAFAVYGEENPVAVPTLFMQGSVDTLFDLSEAARSYHAVRELAPAKLIAFCGGHVPCPESYADAADRDFLDRSILDWFDEHLRGQEPDPGAEAAPGDGGPVVYRTNEGVWRSIDDFPPDDASSLNAAGHGTVVSTPLPTSIRPRSGAGVTGGPLTTAQPNPPGDPHAFTTEVATAAQGDLELVGIPKATLTVSGTGERAHVFLKLVDRESGEVVNLQEAPVRIDRPSAVPQRIDVEMPGIAYTLAPGHHLDLQVSTTSLMHATARTPAELDITAEVRVPVRPR